MRTVSDLFEIGYKPRSWGFRGDEPLWEELSSKFSNVPIPEKLCDFITLLEDAFEAAVGQRVENCKTVFIQRFDTGGMSSGTVSGEFWRKVGFPGLIHRFMLSLDSDNWNEERLFHWVFDFEPHVCPQCRALM